MSAVLLLLVFACRRDPPAEGNGDDRDPPALVPMPVSLVVGDGELVLDDTTRLAGADAVAAAIAEQLAASLRPATGLPLEVDVGDADITLTIDPDAGLPAEGYRLDVTADAATLVAADAAGLFWGTQTIRQLLPPEALGDSLADVAWTMPAVAIEDAPRFAWRGAMIDVARHFFGPDEIERQIDLLALHKLNVLHLHLTDDQGWRIEITSWPNLAVIGGATEVGGGDGGYYTQAEWKALVAYAAERHVTIVPEIDFPGHANAALASYGELNPDGVPAEPYTGTAVLSNGLHLELPVTWELVEDVWTEMIAMTPDGFVHVGADEAIDVADADYAAFVAWLQAHVAAEGRTMVGWDEIGDVALEPGFVIQHWWDEDRAVDAVAMGGKLLSSPAEHAYLDMVHDASATYGQVWAGAIDVEQAYAWDPVPAGLDETDVIGLEGALWTEYIDSRERLDFMLWPRLVAHAEVGWTPAADREWTSFHHRLGVHGRRLDALGVGYYRSNDIGWD